MSEFKINQEGVANQVYIRKLIDFLNARTKEYDEGHPTITDEEWDSYYFQLEKLENETGIYFPDSPTHSIQYDVVNSLRKVKHNHPMLSLAKTKDIEEIKNFLGLNDYVAMCKMDGLTCSLHYQNGILISAETRGNGITGEDILHNAKVIPSIPKKIDYLYDLVVDGEIICTYSDFDNFSSDYKNPRNFASGSIRLLDSQECAKRNLTFVAWDCIRKINNRNVDIDFMSRLVFLADKGFLCAPWTKSKVEDCIIQLKEIAIIEEYPIDGIVFKFNDLEYSESLGATAHHFRNAIAYKFYDEEYETKLFNIEWSMGRTGVLTPVAVFEPVDDGDSIIERASLHNLNIMKEVLGEYPHKGQKIWVCKQNMIIPQISKAEKNNLGHYYEDDLNWPKICPICGQPTAINESEQLYCTNSNCEGKFLNKLDHFVGKKGLDIKGLSKATLEKLINQGWINNIADIFKLSQYKIDWIKLPGFGEKSVTNILNSIQLATSTTFTAFIAALGIPLVGTTIAKELVKNGINTYEDFKQKALNHFDFSKFNGFGPEITSAIWNYDFSTADEIITFLNFTSTQLTTAQSMEQNLQNITVVITGKVLKFKNRDALKTKIEEYGGKVVGAISKNVNILINNDINSTSAKNIAAKQFGIPILTEEAFLEKYSINI